MTMMLKCLRHDWMQGQTTIIIRLVRVLDLALVISVLRSVAIWRTTLGQMKKRNIEMGAPLGNWSWKLRVRNDIFLVEYSFFY